MQTDVDLKILSFEHNAVIRLDFGLYGVRATEYIFFLPVGCE